jgi:general secretion pathway protein C
MSAVIASYARHPWSKLLAVLINVLLAAVLVYLLTRFLWLVLDWNAPLPSAGPMTAPEPAAPPPPSLARWHLFGNAAQVVDPRALANAPETSLPIDLRGVLAGEDPKQGRAFIVDAGGERGVWVGQEVAPGVVLDAVYPDRVALSRGGAIEVLKLRTPESAAPAPATSAPPQRGGASPFNPPAAVAARNGGSAIVPSNGLFGPVTAPVVPMAGVDLEKVKQQLGVDPTVLANQITPLPVMENGKFVGVRLNGGQHAQVLHKLGLQSEDIVTAVNGVPVTDPSRIGPAISSLSSAARIEVTVLRGGKPQTLTVDIPR